VLNILSPKGQILKFYLDVFTGMLLSVRVDGRLLHTVEP